LIVFSVYISFLISYVPPALSFFQKNHILENTAKSLSTYFLRLTIFKDSEDFFTFAV